MPVLYGPDGNVISHGRSAEKKPLVGELVTPWNGERYLDSGYLPSQLNLGFDSRKLTIPDFRLMREHHQVAMSLNLVSMMMYQRKWRIVGDRQKEAKHCTENLKQIWPRLVRAMSKSLWAGYSPCALQWENDIVAGKLWLTKVKDLRPEECTVRWKEVRGVVERNKQGSWMPDVPGIGVKHKVDVFDGIHQRGYSDIPVTNCVSPETLVLMLDNTWRKAKDISVGDMIVGFDETPTDRGGKYRASMVEVNNRVVRDSVTVVNDRGVPVTVSKGHPFLVRHPKTGYGSHRDPVTGRMVSDAPEGATPRYKDEWGWVAAGDLEPGMKVAWFAEPWGGQVPTRDVGYLAGVFDGEAHITRTRTALQLVFTQNEGPVLDEVRRILGDLGFEFVEHRRKDGRDLCTSLYITGGRREIARFVQTVGTVRIGSNHDLSFADVKMVIGKSVDLSEVVSVEEVGEIELCSLQTSTRTLVTQGYCTHNSFWYPLLMEDGDFYGRKLLAAAFRPWYFSMIMHLYANRYMERFAEPTPVGRAPFDDTIRIGEKEYSGNKLMASLLQMQRNGSALILPNSRSVDAIKNDAVYDYTIEYIESQMRGAEFDRVIAMYDEEISLALFTPLLLMRNMDVGSSNLGVVHTQTWLTILNALSMDWEEYINRYILRPMAIHNFGQRAKVPWIEFEPLGRTDSETIRAILQSLLSANKIEFDFEQLSDACGLDVKKATEVTGEDEPVDGVVKRDPVTGEVIGTKRTPSGDNRVGRPGKNVAPTGTDKVKAVAARIAARVHDQATKVFTSGEFGADWSPDLGFRKQFVDTLTELGVDEWEAGGTYSAVQAGCEALAGEGSAAFPTAARFAHACEALIASIAERSVDAAENAKSVAVPV